MAYAALLAAVAIASFVGAYLGTSARLRRVETLLERVSNKTTMVAATTHRVEDAAVKAAEHNAAVAGDLQAAHERADATEGPHGAAADAASRTEQDDSG